MVRLPTASSAKYVSALTIGTTTTVKAIAAATGYYTSAVSSATYDISFPGVVVVREPRRPHPTSFAIFSNGSAVTNGGRRHVWIRLFGELAGQLRELGGA